MTIALSGGTEGMALCFRIWLRFTGLSPSFPLSRCERGKII